MLPTNSTNPLNTFIKIFFCTSLLFLLNSCQPKGSEGESKLNAGEEKTQVAQSHEKPSKMSDSDGLIQEYMSKDRQEDMSHDDILEDLMEGNRRFVHNELRVVDHLYQLNKLSDYQYPKAVVLSCIDSRVPVEQVFDQGVGDLFVIRVAGNIDNNHNLASLEYSCKVSGAKVIIVLAHENCGAITSAVKGVDMGNINELLLHIQPAVHMHPDYEGSKTFDNPEFVNLVAKDNALLTLGDIRRQSPILKKMEDDGKLVLKAAYFDMHTGEVSIVEEK